VGRRRMVTGGLAATLALGLIGGVPAVGGSNSETATVVGRVTFQGEPVQGARMQLEDPEAVRTYGFISTDADGRYRFDDVPTDTPGAQWALEAWLVDDKDFTYHALTTYSGNTPRLWDATTYALPPGSTTTIDIEMVPAATVTGRVVDVHGDPVRGAKVRVWDPGRSFTPEEWAKTDAEGRYTVSRIDSGLVVVDVSIGYWKSPRTGSREVTVQAPHTTTVEDIVVRSAKKVKAGKISAKVSRLEAGDEIYLYNPQTRRSLWLGVSASKKGTLKFTKKVDPGKYRLIIAGKNTASKVFTVHSKKITKVPPFKGPKKTITIKGKLRKANGKVAKKARATLYDSYGTTAGVRMGDNGKYTYKAKGKGKYFLEVRLVKHYFSRTSVAVKSKPGATVKKDATLAKLVTVRGTVKDGTKPVGGLLVSVEIDPEGLARVDYPDEYWDKISTASPRGSFPHAPTDRNGRFALRKVPVGAQVLRVREDNSEYGGYRDVRSAVVVKPGSDVTIEMSR